MRILSITLLSLDTPKLSSYRIKYTARALSTRGAKTRVRVKGVAREGVTLNTMRASVKRILSKHFRIACKVRQLSGSERIKYSNTRSLSQGKLKVRFSRTRLRISIKLSNSSLKMTRRVRHLGHRTRSKDRSKLWEIVGSRLMSQPRSIRVRVQSRQCRSIT